MRLTKGSVKQYRVSQRAVLVFAAALAVVTPIVLRSSAITAQPNIPYRSILAKVPPNIRTRFLESLVFLNGGLAGAYAGDIKASLPKAEYEMMLRQLGFGFGRTGEDHVGYECSKPGECKESARYICDPAHCAPPPGGGDGGGALTMGSLLSSTPAAMRLEFLESLDFANGRLVSANVAGIRSRLSQADFERLFARFGIPASQLKVKINGGYYRP